MNLLLDLFFHNPEIYRNENVANLFFLNSYPILLKSADSDVSTDIDVAVDFYLQILGRKVPNNSIGTNILRRFIVENPNNPYVGDAKDQLDQIEEGIGENM